MILKRTLLSLLAAALLSIPTTGLADSRDWSRSTPTIVISFDGAQPQVIEKMIRNGKLPSNGGFAKLIREGTKTDGMTGPRPVSLTFRPTARAPKSADLRRSRNPNDRAALTYRDKFLMPLEWLAAQLSGS